jgi:5'-phosphate synthase pdxT subunit
MKTPLSIGILAYHGDVEEHSLATTRAGEKLGIKLNIVEVRVREDLVGLRALIIPGGESTTMQKLAEQSGIWNDLKKIPCIFGTCAGSIMLAKSVEGKTEEQKTLALMNIEVSRNAYGRQNESFEEEIKTSLGNLNAVFIRAPKILFVGKNVTTLSKLNGEIIACEEKTGDKYYLATTFHPEFSSAIFHEHFLKQISTSASAKVKI